MVKKCIGIREDSGDKCNRSASSGSDFCYQHQSQKDDATILNMGADVYHCPQDGTELFRDYRNNYHITPPHMGIGVIDYIYIYIYIYKK